MGMTTKIHKMLFVVTCINPGKNTIIVFWNYVPFIECVHFCFNNLLSFLSCQGTHSSGTSSLVSSPDEHSSIRSGEDDGVKIKPSRDTHIHSKPNNWYSGLCNRWFSLVGVRLQSSSMYGLCVYENLVILSVVNAVPEIRSSRVVHRGTVYPLVRPDLWIKFCH
jgi:hypothetical protein